MFAVFSSTQERPVIRDWYPTRVEAEAAIPDFRRVDREVVGTEEEDYFVAELTPGEVRFYRESGFVGSGEVSDAAR
jgi:hypothetical protein